MRDYVGSTRVALVVVVMAVVLMSGTAVAVGPPPGQGFTLYPNSDDEKGWPMPSDLDHFCRVNDADGEYTIQAIGNNENYAATDVFGLPDTEKSDAIWMWYVKGVMHARGRSATPPGEGKIEVWVKKGADYLYLGEYKPWATASQFEPFESPKQYSDWTQTEINYAEIKVTGHRPVYTYGASPSGSTYVEEIRVRFNYN